MDPSIPDRRRSLSLLAIGLGVVAVILVAASFATEAATTLRMSALVLIVLGLAAGRASRTQPPPPG